MMVPRHHGKQQIPRLLHFCILAISLSLATGIPFGRWRQRRAASSTKQSQPPKSSSSIHSKETGALQAKHPIHHLSPADDDNDDVPLIDLSLPEDILIPQIGRACQSPGFFQVTNHGIDQTLIRTFRHQIKLYYDQPMADKLADKRSAYNARGFFDDEYTKQRRDFKQGLDVGVPGSRDWHALDKDDPRNQHCLDGLNLFPRHLPDYRSTTVAYFQACENLAQRLTMLMARGLEWILLQEQQPQQQVPSLDSSISTNSTRIAQDAFLQDMAVNHSSYLRTNYYPPTEQTAVYDPDTLGISPHKDAGFLTILLQDDDCHSLQVPLLQANGRVSWTTVHPRPGALTINTGDMAQVWSNGLYQAPLHRVLTHTTKPRYSAPFFYNPPYHSLIAPLPHLFPQETSSRDESQQRAPLYHPVLWAYFRGLRFAGDWTDLGVEIQIEHFAKDAPTDYGHLARQREFIRRGLDGERYNVAKLQELIHTTTAKSKN